MAKKQIKKENNVDQQFENAVTNVVTKMMQSNPSMTYNDAQIAFGNMYKNNPIVKNQIVKEKQPYPFYEKNRNELEKSIQNFQSSDKRLRDVGEYYGIEHYPMYKSQRMSADILSYHWKYEPRYLQSNKEQSKKIIKDMQFLDKGLKKYNPSYWAHIAAQKLMRQGKNAYVARDIIDENEKEVKAATIQYLPIDWWEIVGENSQSGYSIMFNFNYFFQAGTRIEDYPDFMQDIYQAFLKMSSDEIPKGFEKNKNFEFTFYTDAYQEKKKYITSSNEQLKKESKILCEKYGSNTIALTPKLINNSWYMWARLPIDRVFVLSIDPSHPYKIPPQIGMLLPAMDKAYYMWIQKQRVQLPLDVFFTGTLELVDTGKNTIASNARRPYAAQDMIIQEAYDDFNTIMRSSGTIGKDLLMLPAKDIKSHQFNNDPDGQKVIEDYNRAFNSEMGQTGMIATDSKPNAGMVANSRIIESEYTSIIYPQINRLFNTIIQIWKEKGYLKYDWEFEMFGNHFSDKDDLMQCEKSLTLTLNGHFARYLALKGMTLLDYLTNSMVNKAIKIYGNNEQLESAFNAKANKENGTNGRPIKQIEEIENDNTMEKRDNKDEGA